MIQNLTLDLEIENDNGLPSGTVIIDCDEFSNSLIRIRAKTESDDFRVFISNHIQKYKSVINQSQDKHNKAALIEIIEDLKLLESIICNGGDFSVYRKHNHNLYGYFRLYNETMELMIYFCEMREFAFLLNQFYELDDSKLFDNQGIKKFYEMICYYIKIHHSQSDSSIFLKSWLLLYRLIAKPKKDNLHKYVSKKIFRDVFDHLVNNINEICFSAVLYHYLYHFWRDTTDEFIYPRTQGKSSDFTKTLVSEYRYSLICLNRIHSAYQKFEKTFQFDFDPHYWAGEVALDLKLMKIEDVIRRPIINTYFPEDEHKVNLVKDLGQDSVTLFFEFLNNKYTDDFIRFIQDRNFVHLLQD